MRLAIPLGRCVGDLDGVFRFGDGVFSRRGEAGGELKLELLDGVLCF